MWNNYDSREYNYVLTSYLCYYKALLGEKKPKTILFVHSIRYDKFSSVLGFCWQVKFGG